jgi:hypothetical protein
MSMSSDNSSIRASSSVKRLQIRSFTLSALNSASDGSEGCHCVFVSHFIVLPSPPSPSPPFASLTHPSSPLPSPVAPCMSSTDPRWRFQSEISVLGPCACLRLPR